jgi:hypothetical protein
LAGAQINKKGKIHGVEKSGVLKDGNDKIPSPFTNFLRISMVEGYDRCVSPQPKEMNLVFPAKAWLQVSDHGMT